MLDKIKKIVIVSLCVLLVTACGSDGGNDVDPNLDISPVGSISLSAVEDDATTLTVPLSYLVFSVDDDDDDIEDELSNTRIYAVNKTQDTVFAGHADNYYSEDQLLVYTLNRESVVNVSPASDGDEMTVVILHSDDSWEKYSATLRDDRSVTVSPDSGDDAFSENERDDVTVPEELWCYMNCDACDDDQTVSTSGGATGIPFNPLKEGTCPED